MKLKHWFILYVIFLHALIAFFAFKFFISQRYWFIGIEVLLACSLIIAFRIYRQMIRPMELMSSGIQSIRDRDFSIKYRPVGSKELDELIGVFNNMIDRLRAERTIQQEQHFFLQKLMEAAPVGILILDGNDRIREVNNAAARILKNLPEVLAGKKPEEIPSLFALYLGNLTEDHPATIRIDGIRSYRISRSHFMNLGYRNSFLLIDELTNEMLAIEKEAFGKVIRMMSHEVNNSIGATNSILQTLKSVCAALDPEQSTSFGQAVEVVIERNSNLNRFMNNLANVIRLPVPQLELCDLNLHVGNIVRLMEPSCSMSRIRLETSLPDQPVRIMMDPGQMEQLLVNVIKNAAESIGEQGEIHVRLDPRNMELRVEDTGKGISPDHEKKLFTPFFSSKKNGQGIGLTVAREIAHQHGFGISLKNRPGGGAVFLLSIQNVP